METAERRTERRLLCSNLVQITWSSLNGRCRTEIGVLEDLSRSGFGICVHVGISIRRGTALSILANHIEFRGRVIYSTSRENGYLVGLQLDRPCEWDDGFGPEHLLDVMLLNLG